MSSCPCFHYAPSYCAFVYLCINVSACGTVSVFSGGLKCFQRQHPASQHAVGRPPSLSPNTNSLITHWPGVKQINCTAALRRLQWTSQTRLGQRKPEKAAECPFLPIKITGHMEYIICLGQCETLCGFSMMLRMFLGRVPFAMLDSSGELCCHIAAITICRLQ